MSTAVSSNSSRLPDKVARTLSALMSIKVWVLVSASRLNSASTRSSLDAKLE